MRSEVTAVIIPKPVKIGGLFVGCLVTTEQAGEYLRMVPQPALQHVMMTMGSSISAVAMFNNTTFASVPDTPQFPEIDATWPSS
jgi:hypothetical protein